MLRDSRRVEAAKIQYLALGVAEMGYHSGLACYYLVRLTD